MPDCSNLLRVDQLSDPRLDHEFGPIAVPVRSLLAPIRVRSVFHQWLNTLCSGLLIPPALLSVIPVFSVVKKPGRRRLDPVRPGGEFVLYI